MKKKYTTLFALLLSASLSAQSPCLIASYPFDGNANDVTGNGHDGTVHGAVLATDRFGEPNSCYQFDGVSDDIRLAGTFSSNQGTVTAWINMSDMSLLNTVFSGRDTTTNGMGVELDVDPNSTADANQLSYGLDHRDCVGGGCNVFFVIGEPELSQNTWYQVAMASDGSTVTIYIDCQPVATYFGSCGDGGGLWFDDLCQNVTWMIGRNKRPLSESFFAGRIDDLQIFDCALTSSQIDSLCQPHSTTSVSVVNRSRHIAAYPNPSTGVVQITGFPARSDHVVHVMDLTGRAITASFQPIGNDIMLDLSNVRAGTYLILVDGQMLRMMRE